MVFILQHEMYEGTYFVPEGAYFIPGEVTDKSVNYGPITIGKFPAYVKQKKIAKENNFCKEFTVSILICYNCV